MVVGIALFVVAVLIIAIWILIEFKRLKHKLFAIFLIALILFSYISFTVVIKDQNINFKTVDGLTKASKLYLGWLGSVFGNMKSITSYAVQQDWSSTENTDDDSNDW